MGCQIRGGHGYSCVESSLGVTIGGRRYRHLLFQLVLSSDYQRTNVNKPVMAKWRGITRKAKGVAATIRRDRIVAVSMAYSAAMVQGKLEEELPRLQCLPPAPVPEYVNHQARVRKWSTIQAAGRTYGKEVPPNSFGRPSQADTVNKHAAGPVHQLAAHLIPEGVPTLMGADLPAESL